MRDACMVLIGQKESETYRELQRRFAGACSNKMGHISSQRLLSGNKNVLRCLHLRSTGEGREGYQLIKKRVRYTRRLSLVNEFLLYFFNWVDSSNTTGATTHSARQKLLLCVCVQKYFPFNYAG